MIDPYQLLGLTIESTPAEARAAFRDIALVVHPDKGGCGADMKTLIDAYQYVIEQLKGVNRTVTVEDMEADFAAFCLAQKNDDGDVEIQDILKSLSNCNFNKVFDRRKKEDVDQLSGYGAMMAVSEYSTTEFTTESTEVPIYKPICETDVLSQVEEKEYVETFKRDVIVYAEANASNFYSKSDSRGTDYVDAFNTTPEPMYYQPPLHDDIDARMADLLKQREIPYMTDNANTLFRMQASEAETCLMMRVM